MCIRLTNIGEDGTVMLEFYAGKRYDFDPLYRYALFYKERFE